MSAIKSRWWLINQEATDFTHVDENCALVVNAVLPKGRSAEFFAQHDRTAAYQAETNADQSAVTVINGQAYVAYVILREFTNVPE